MKSGTLKNKTGNQKSTGRSKTMGKSRSECRDSQSINQVSFSAKVKGGQTTNDEREFGMAIGVEWEDAAAQSDNQM